MQRNIVKATLAAVVVLLWAVLTPASKPQNRQVIFSADSVAGTFNYTAPTPAPADNHFGFWIWCEGPTGNNPYAGKCNGAMYFYGLGVTRSVDGSVSSPSSGIFTMSVFSNDSEIVCSLTNETPNNGGGAIKSTIDVSCPPSGVSPGVIQGTGTLDNAVVNVTNQ